MSLSKERRMVTIYTVLQGHSFFFVLINSLEHVSCNQRTPSLASSPGRVDRRPAHTVRLQLSSTGVLYVGLPAPVSCVVRRKWSVGLWNWF